MRIWLKTIDPPEEIVEEDDDLEDDGFEDDELEEGDEFEDDEDDDEEDTIVPDVVVIERAPVAAGVVVGEYQPSPAAFTQSGPRSYRLPDLSLFDPPQAHIVDESQRPTLLEDTLASFGVGAKVTHIERGPAVTRYELKPDRGVKISRISALADDIALVLAATSIRIEAPIPGKSAVGIEVPNAQVSIVSVGEILQSLPMRGQIPPLNVALGKDITGRPVFGDLAKMPHLLVAGATGSGKSVCLNAMLASLLVSATPDQLQLLLIDPKRVELTLYNGIPHLIKDVITDPRLAAGALFEMTREMDSRYERFAKAGVRKIEEYNAKYPDETLPYVCIFIDEGRNDDLPDRTARPRHRNPSRRRDAAPFGRRDHRNHQGERPLAHRFCGQLTGRLAHDPRHGRRRAPPRPRRHALSSDRRAEARTRTRRAHHGPGNSIDC